ncbi:MAG: hypothetical protein HDT43_10740 [Ruminococcaceae bacterium]|nr:hypothetical protein [Oscillospiraceae bacterium]
MDLNLENTIAFLIPMTIAVLIFAVIIVAACRYSREKRKFKKAAKATAVINTSQTLRERIGAPGSRHTRYHCKLEYSYEDKSGNFHDITFAFTSTKIPPKHFEYGDEIEIVYDENATENTIPWFLIKRERIMCAVMGFFVVAILAAISFMFFHYILPVIGG